MKYWREIISSFFQAKNSATMKSMLSFLWILFFSFSILNIFYWPVQHFLVKESMTLVRIPDLYVGFSVLALIVLLTLLQNKIFNLAKTKLYILAFVTFSLAIFSYQRFYAQEKAFYQQPVIYSVTPNWGIQGMGVKISGVRFSDSNQVSGQIIIGDQEMLIVNWSDETIIAKLKVPERLGPSKLKIIRSDGVLSNEVDFLLKDPSELGK